MPQGYVKTCAKGDAKYVRYPKLTRFRRMLVQGVVIEADAGVDVLIEDVEAASVQSMTPRNTYGICEAIDDGVVCVGRK